MIILGIKNENEESGVKYNFWLSDKDNVLKAHLLSTKNFQFGKKIFEEKGFKVYKNVVN